MAWDRFSRDPDSALKLEILQNLRSYVAGSLGPVDFR